MAFWGIEIKPGKPYIHSYDNSCGRLHISQATLGNGKSTSMTTVQCNVGKKSPILLCKLIPNVLETCHLDLEFEETEEAVFSVLGDSSAYLSGYYIGSCGHNLDGENTDSYGEDISGTDMSESYSSYDDEDEYESDFIDDDDIGMFPPQRKSGVVIEEIVEDEKPSNENANRRRSKKKHQLKDSDDGGDGSEKQLVVKHNASAVLESEDEDGFPISLSSRRDNVKDSKGISDFKSNDKTINEERNKNIDDLSQDGRSARETLPMTETSPENNVKPMKTKKSRDEKSLGTTEADEGADNDGKTKKKKKRKKGKDVEAVADVSMEKTEDKAINEITQSSDNVKMDQDPPVTGELEKLTNRNELADTSVPSTTTQETSGKLKKKNKKKRAKDDIELADTSVPSTTTQETSGKLKKKNKKKRAKDDMGSDAQGGEVNDVRQTDAKRKKKDDKNNGKDLTLAKESGEPGKSEISKSGRKSRTYANGLIIEELAMGKPDGQKATPGKKVSVNYIGKLKNGKIFDSNVGKRPFTFRLGIGEVIKGWDVGVNGMRVGDKRRITVPPIYGYGEKAMGPIPPNSWLLFDVELVSVK